MNKPDYPEFEDAEIVDGWATGPQERLERSRRIAWIIACVSAAIALLLAVALVVLMPLKTTEPYTLLVDRQTGHVEALAPLDERTIAPDAALARSMLAQYVIARESYDAASLQRDYRRVSLWSGGEERQRYARLMQPSNPTGPVETYGRNGTVQVEIKSVSSLSARQSLVRFVTIRTDRGSAGRDIQHWAAIIDYAFVEGAMTADDRLLNPLGFQVVRYRRDAETLPELVEADPSEQADAR